MFLCLYHYLVVVKTVWFETANIPHGTVHNFSGHCSIWCYRVREMSVHLPQNSDYYRRIKGCAVVQMVEALRYMVSLVFFIYIILLAALWPWG